MPLVSMKVPQDVYPAPTNYGYGLRICLSAEQVEALGLDKAPPQPGAEVGLRAIARVCVVTQEADPDQEAAEGESAASIDVRLELQITDLEVTAGAPASAAATVLYGG